MPRFERRLIGPTDEELAGALLAAARVGGGGAAERLGPTYWARFVADARSQPEGFRTWADGTWALLAVAWWTDHLGRRHFRLCSGRTEGDLYQHFLGLSDDSRPPLWYVYPERIVCRVRDGQAEWLAACACGACGAPRELAWMGPCCGVCHDRGQEGAAAPPPALLGRPRTPVHALAFAPDGRHVAAAKAGRSVEVYYLTTGAVRVLLPPADGFELTALAYAPDGQTLAAGSTEGEVLVLEGGGEPRRLAVLAGGVRDLEFSPDGRVLAACAGRDAMGVWRLGADDCWGQWPGLTTGTALAFSPQGDVLALGRPGGWVSLIDLGRGAELRRFGTRAPVGHDARLVAFLPGGHGLLTLSGADPAGETAFDLPHNFRGRLQAWDRLGRQLGGYRADLPPFSVGGLSPDRRWLAWVVYDPGSSPAAVTFWEIAAGRVRASLEWNSDEGLLCLAFSPDGRLLATGGQNGTVKLWPWRELLEA